MPNYNPTTRVLETTTFQIFLIKRHNNDSKSCAPCEWHSEHFCIQVQSILDAVTCKNSNTVSPTYTS